MPFLPFCHFLPMYGVLLGRRCLIPPIWGVATETLPIRVPGTPIYCTSSKFHIILSGPYPSEEKVCRFILLGRYWQRGFKTAYSLKQRQESVPPLVEPMLNHEKESLISFVVGLKRTTHPSWHLFFYYHFEQPFIYVSFSVWGLVWNNCASNQFSFRNHMFRCAGLSPSFFRL